MPTPGPTSHVITGIAVLLAVFLLYMLSSAPVLVLAVNGRIPDSLFEPLIRIYHPALQITKNPPLEKPFKAYYRWWSEVLIHP